MNETSTMDSVMNGLSQWGMSILGAIAILLIGFWLSRFLAELVDKACGKSQKIDPAIRQLLVRLVRIAVIAFTIIATMQKFGIPTTSLVAVLGAAGLAVGLALQGTLSNIASGVMLLALRPFTIGHAVNLGGSVYVIDSIGLFVTKAHEPDGPTVTIQNTSIWGSRIINYSVTHNDLRRVNEVVGISYGDDIGKAIEIIQNIIASDERFLKDPEPVVAVQALGSSSVDLTVKAWTKREDWLDTKLDFTRAAKEKLEAGGIVIPFPQTDVHLFTENK